MTSWPTKNNSKIPVTNPPWGSRGAWGSNYRTWENQVDNCGRRMDGQVHHAYMYTDTACTHTHTHTRLASTTSPGFCHVTNSGWFYPFVLIDHYRSMYVDVRWFIQQTACSVNGRSVPVRIWFMTKRDQTAKSNRVVTARISRKRSTDQWS